jgi:hypothetical protein
MAICDSHAKHEPCLICESTVLILRYTDAQQSAFPPDSTSRRSRDMDRPRYTCFLLKNVHGLVFERRDFKDTATFYFFLHWSNPAPRTGPEGCMDKFGSHVIVRYREGADHAHSQ